ncbi:MAG: MG2 domain-containing protein, partial [Verrucomicrobiota bacterium]
YWKTEDHAVFMPEKHWQAGMEYTLTPHKGLRDTHGRRVKPFSRTIRTEALRCLSAEQTGFNSRRQATLRILFNHAPDRDSLKKFLSLVKPNNKGQLRHHLVAGSVPEELIIQTDPVSSSSFTILIRKGLKSRNGKLGLARTFTRKLYFQDTMRLTKARASSHAFQPSSMHLTFSTPPESARLHEYIRVEPAASYSIHVSRNRVSLKGDFVPGSSYRLDIREGLPAANGTTLHTAVQKRVYFPEVEPTLALREKGRYLSPNGQMRLPVDSINVSSILAEAHRIYPNNLVYFVNRHSKYNSAYRSLSHKVAERRFPVKAEMNRSTRTAIELKQLVGDHGPGVYMIGLSAEEDLDDRQLVVLTDIGITLKHSKQDLLIWANHIHDLEPVDGGVVKVYSKKNQLLYTGQTADDGLARIRLDRAGEDNKPFLVTVQQGRDISWLDFSGTRVNGLANQGDRDFVEQGYEAFVFTDRGVYRPGETIHVKSIVRGKDLSCPAPFPVRLKVIRPDGRTWREWTELLNPFGSVGFDIVLDEYLPTGRFGLQCTLPGDDAILGYQSVAVESFVPPQIRVAIDTDEARVPAQAHLDFQVEAEHLFGAKAKGLPVEAWVIYRSIPFAPSGWEGYQFGDRTRKAIEERQSGIAGKLDEEGRFTASVEMDWGSRNPPGALKALIGASVKNMSGRSVSAYGARTVDPYPYYIGIQQAALKDLELGNALTIPVAAVQADGQVMDRVESLAVKVERIYYTRIRNNDRYVSEKRTEIVDEGQLVMKEGKGTWPLNPKKPGSYLIRISDPDSDVTGTAQFYVSETAYDYAWKADKPDRLVLELEGDRFVAGDLARLTVKAPFTGKALIVLEQGSLIQAWTKVLDRNTQT